MKNTITIAFVDDIPNHRKEIKVEIEKYNHLKIVAEAEEGRDLITQIFGLNKKNQLPEIILMDLQMPKCDGLTATILCKWFFPHIKVVGLSVHTNASVISQFLLEGGDGFLSKHIVQSGSIVYNAYIQNNALLHAIDKILDGQIYIDEVLNEVDKINIMGTSCKKMIDTKYSFLQKREIDYLMLNAAGFSRKEISNFLELGEPSVKLIISKYLKLFNLQNNGDLNRYAIMNGLIKYVELYQNTTIKEGLN